MRILMVFGHREDLRLWLRECGTAGRVNLPQERIYFADGSVVYCGVLRDLEDCQRFAGIPFGLVLYHKGAQAPEAVREWAKLQTREPRGDTL